MSEDTNPLMIGVPRETCPGERRVALVPATLTALKKAGIDVILEPGAGQEAGFPDEAYVEKGATLAADRADVFAKASVILQVSAAGANAAAGADDLALFREGQTLIASCDPLSEPKAFVPLAERNVRTFALELLPRITRAQSMDVLSSMATVAGYKAVMLAADHLPRMFPMMMTAAGTIAPARVFVIGAGVAGLQAIATAKRLGAVVQAYDVRPAVKEQVESLGGKFVEFDLKTENAEQSGGYAKAMDEEFYRKQREMMAKVVADNDVVITTAAIPGRTSPVLVTAEMVTGMRPGSIIVDLAAERGGNCELTQADKTVVESEVTIMGPVNLPATIPYHASEMYSKNISTMLLSLIKEGSIEIDYDDEIVKDTLVTDEGQVVQPRIRELLELEPLNPPDSPPAADEAESVPETAEDEKPSESTEPKTDG